jgi:hypothetical protein
MSPVSVKVPRYSSNVSIGPTCAPIISTPFVVSSSCQMSAPIKTKSPSCASWRSPSEPNRKVTLPCVIATAKSDQRVTWAREARTVLGGQVEVDAMLARALRPRATPVRSTVRSDGWVAATAERVVTVLEGSRATWQTWAGRG